MMEESRQSLIGDARRVVVKVGSGVLQRRGGGLDEEVVADLAHQVSSLRAEGRQVVLVSSGAIAAGLHRLQIPGVASSIPLKQAAAAIGQAQLIWTYERFFQKGGLLVAQVLLTHEDVGHRARYLNARNTLTTLLKYDLVPIVNENDTVAVDEIKFGDNDMLSAFVADLVDADLFVILTDIDGLYTADPSRDPTARRLEVVDKITPEMEAGAGLSPTAHGTGGMVTKLEAAKRVTAGGIPTVIASGKASGILEAIVRGDCVGTLFLGSAHRMPSRKRWMTLHQHPMGTLTLDDGAVRALVECGKSLLPSGVKEVQGDFRFGDLVRCVDGRRREIARGLANYGSEEVKKIMGLRSTEIETALGYKHSDELIHRDDLVILETVP